MNTGILDKLDQSLTTEEAEAMEFLDIECLNEDSERCPLEDV